MENVPTERGAVQEGDSSAVSSFKAELMAPRPIEPTFCRTGARNSAPLPMTTLISTYPQHKTTQNRLYHDSLAWNEVMAKQHHVPHGTFARSYPSRQRSRRAPVACRHQHHLCRKRYFHSQQNHPYHSHHIISYQVISYLCHGFGRSFDEEVLHRHLFWAELLSESHQSSEVQLHRQEVVGHDPLGVGEQRG